MIHAYRIQFTLLYQLALTRNKQQEQINHWADFRLLFEKSKLIRQIGCSAIMMHMAANQDNVEEKATKEHWDKTKDGKDSSQVERELNKQDVSYKIKNNTDKM